MHRSDLHKQRELKSSGAGRPSHLPAWPRLTRAAGSALAVLIASVTGSAAAYRATPERVALPASWKATQFVQADAAGHVALLRADTLEVYPVTAKGALGTPSRLEPLAGGDEQPFFRDAALSTDGDAWLLLDVIGPRLFRNGKEQQLPELGWRPEALAMPRSEPFAAVLPIHPHEVKLVVTRDGRVVADAKEPPPLLVGLVGSEWKTVVAEDYEFGTKNWHEAQVKMRLLRAVRLAADPKGGMWMADTFAYRLRRFSPAGRLTGELAVGSGKPKLVERSPAEIEKRQVEVGKIAGLRPDPASVRSTAARAVDGLTVARDGNVYLVVEVAGTEGKPHLALDRFDPRYPSLMRLPLEGLDPIAGHLSLAAGRDALYIAGFSAPDGLWRLPWGLLEAGRWEPVADAKLDGQPLATE